jgi:phytoene dehydrogenase-like protein
MSKKYDAIIVGGGHNGLVCAAYLAKAGKSVVVLERRHLVGGAAVTEEIYPGFQYSVCSYVVSLLRPAIIRDLQLARFGLQVVPLEATFTPYPDGRSLMRSSDPAATRREIQGFSRRDADVYPEFGRAMGQLARFAKPIIDEEAPLPDSVDPRELMKLLGLSRRFRALGDDLATLQYKLTIMSAVDFLREWFECDELIAPMSCSGIIGTMLGVKSPGTAYVLLHHYMGEIDGSSRAWGFARGGTGAISQSIARAAEHFGAEIRCSSAVQQIKVRGGEASGVVLDNGDELDANIIISGCEPRLTFLGLVGERELPESFATDIKRYKLRGSSGKVNLALDRFPDFACRPGDGLHMRGDISIAPSTDYLERAYDEAKYGAYSSKPFLNIVFPSLLDRDMAPPGKHVMSIFVQYAPYHLAGGPETWPEHKEAFGDVVIDTLAEYCPTLKESILHRQIVTPWDLEQEFGMTEGNIFHGELSLDQLLFQRPVQKWARYKTPIHRLWLCGSGAHPGGGVMGGPGQLAAEKILRTGAC